MRLHHKLTNPKDFAAIFDDLLFADVNLVVSKLMYSFEIGETVYNFRMSPNLIPKDVSILTDVRIANDLLVKIKLTVGKDADSQEFLYQLFHWISNRSKGKSLNDGKLKTKWHSS